MVFSTALYPSAADGMANRVDPNQTAAVEQSDLDLHCLLIYIYIGAPVAHWVKRWPTDLADRVRSPLETKFAQP